MSVLFCTNGNIIHYKLYGNLMRSFLNEYKWLLDAYILDFFTENYWENLPTIWQEALDEIDLEELSQFIGNEESYGTDGKPWPLSLQAFRKVTRILSWPRTAIPFDDVKKLLEVQVCNTNSGNKAGMLKGKSKEKNNVLWKIFQRHMKPKKQHEIDLCAKVALHLLDQSGSEHIVDIGAGQGHFSRILAFGYGVNVVALEGESCHITGARKYDQQATNELYKKLRSEDHLRKSDGREWLAPKHVEYRLTSASTANEISKVLLETWSNDGTKLENVPRFGMVGLHTCGNLAAILLQRFVDMEQACTLLSVGCCYMKLDDDGFPMSAFLHDAKLSYEAKEIACHAIEMYAKKLKCKDDALQLKIHCFRGILEKLIVSQYPEKRHMGLKSIRNVKNMNFSLYMEKALDSLPFTISKDWESSPFVRTAEEQWMRVVVFYSLRLMIAPVVESFLLLDRLLYLHEKGVSSCLLPVFDPLISPRNHLLLAVKTSNTNT